MSEKADEKKSVVAKVFGFLGSGTGVLIEVLLCVTVLGTLLVMNLQTINGKSLELSQTLSQSGVIDAMLSLGIRIFMTGKFGILLTIAMYLALAAWGIVGLKWVFAYAKKASPPSS